MLLRIEAQTEATPRAQIILSSEGELQVINQTRKWKTFDSRLHPDTAKYHLMHFIETDKPKPELEEQPLKLEIQDKSLQGLWMVGKLNAILNLSGKFIESAIVQIDSKGKTVIDFGDSSELNIILQQSQLDSEVEISGKLKGLIIANATNDQFTFSNFTCSVFICLDPVPAEIAARITVRLIHGHVHTEMTPVETTRQRYVKRNITIPEDDGPATSSSSTKTKKRSHPTEPCIIMGPHCTGIANALLLPCEHRVACLKCTKMMWEVPLTDFNCPVDRTPIEEVRKCD